jgi:hypothetical protein
MTSVETRFAQRDNRLETVTLTGNITDNGTIDSINNVPPQNPAYAQINVTKAQNFYIDARTLRLRTDAGGTGIEYLIRIYMDSTKPPLYNQNFEWTILITLPPEVANKWTEIQVYQTKAEAESINENYSFALTNVNDNDVITTYSGVVAITMQLLDNTYILKSCSPQLYYG